MSATSCVVCSSDGFLQCRQTQDTCKSFRPQLDTPAAPTASCSVLQQPMRATAVGATMSGGYHARPKMGWRTRVK